jgi:hypothetical protein
VIVVKVEFHSANTNLITELGRATITNVGGSEALGDYIFKIEDKFPKSIATRRGSIRAFPRLRMSAWDLLKIALNGGETNAT